MKINFFPHLWPFHKKGLSTPLQEAPWSPTLANQSAPVIPVRELLFRCRIQALAQLLGGTACQDLQPAKAEQEGTPCCNRKSGGATGSSMQVYSLGHHLRQWLRLKEVQRSSRALIS